MLPVTVMVRPVSKQTISPVAGAEDPTSVVPVESVVQTVVVLLQIPDW